MQTKQQAQGKENGHNMLHDRISFCTALPFLSTLSVQGKLFLLDAFTYFYTDYNSTKEIKVNIFTLLFDLHSHHVV